MSEGLFKTFAQRAGACVLAATALTSSAWAQVNFTDAGTEVTNSFSLDYSVNNVAQAQIVGAADPFTVDRLVDLLVSYQSNDDDDDVQPGAVATAMLFKLENDGNDTFAYTLAVTNQTGEADPEFDLTGSITIQYSVNTDGDNVYEPGADDGALTNYNGTRTPDVEKGDSLWLLVSGDVPVGVADAAIANIVLTATAVEPTAWAVEAGAVAGTALTADSDGNDVILDSDAENVFADGAGSGGDSANDAIHSDVGTFTISTATLVATKTVSVLATNLDGAFACEDFAEGLVSSDEYSTPGACVEYQISIQNTGSAPAAITEVEDELPVGLIFKAAQASGFTTAGAFDTPPDADTVCNGADNCTLSYTGAALNAGVTGTINIRALDRLNK